MRQLEDFRDKIENANPSFLPKKEELVFPRNYLQRVYGIMSLGVLLMTLTFFLHGQFPGFLSIFYDFTPGHTVIKSTPFVLGCIAFPIGIPLLYMNWRNKNTNEWMVSFTVIHCVAMGTAFAFISMSVGYSLLLVPMLICVATFAIMSALCYTSPEVAAGKYAEWVTFIPGFTLAILVNSVIESNWVCWLLSFGAVVGPCYIGVNMQRQLVIANLKNPPDLTEEQRSLIGGLTLIFDTCLGLFPYMRFTNRKFVAGRKWMDSSEQIIREKSQRKH